MPPKQYEVSLQFLQPVTFLDGSNKYIFSLHF
jgi:hypothetical protein